MNTTALEVVIYMHIDFIFDDFINPSITQNKVMMTYTNFILTSPISNLFIWLLRRYVLVSYIVWDSRIYVVYYKAWLLGNGLF